MSTLAPLHQALVDAGFPADIAQADGGLFNLGGYVGFTPTNNYVVLDGEFTVAQLKALAAWVEATQLVATTNMLDALRQESMQQKIVSVFAASPPYTPEDLAK